MNTKHFGTLYIVATPIGNLGDMTSRAVEILRTVDCIAAEDTRHSASLLQHYSINKPMLALHEHNERERTEQLCQRLLNGESIALISDAGTPLICDPGYVLVRGVRQLNIKVVPVPGPCAAITALCAAGLPTDRFIFEGFLPAKSKQRTERLSVLLPETRTLIFYEAPHRILDCLQDMQQIWGPDRELVIARELTKMFETIRAGTCAELIAWVSHDSNQERGELVIIAAGNPVAEEVIPAEHILKMLLEELPLKTAVELAAKISGHKKNELYKKALGWKA